MGLAAAGRGGKLRSPAPPAASAPKDRLAASAAGRGARTPLSSSAFPGFEAVKCTYMQGLTLPVSYRFLVSPLCRRKTYFEISKLCRVGNAVSVEGRVLPWGLSASSSHGVSVLWKGPEHCRGREVFQIANIWEEKTFRAFAKPETLPKVGCRVTTVLLSTGLSPPRARDAITASSPGWLFRVDQKNT